MCFLGGELSGQGLTQHPDLFGICLGVEVIGHGRYGDMPAAEVKPHVPTLRGKC